MPTMSSALSRRLPLSVAGAGLITGLIGVALIETLGRPDWWPAFEAASIVAAIGVIVSISILRQTAGRRVDTAVTVVMAASVVRVMVSLIGLIVAVKLYKAPPDATGLMICGYYAAMLVAETTLVSRATRGAAVKIGDGNA